jgi:hypothetical protein
VLQVGYRSRPVLPGGDIIERGQQDEVESVDPGDVP